MKKTLFIATTCFAAIVAAAGCSKKDDTASTTNTTGATMNAPPNGAINGDVNGNATAPASGGTDMKGPFELKGQGTGDVSDVSGAPIPGDTTNATNAQAPSNGHHDNSGANKPMPNLDHRGDSFEASGGSSGLGATTRHRDVPGQHLFDVGRSRDGGAGDAGR